MDKVFPLSRISGWCSADGPPVGRKQYRLAQKWIKVKEFYWILAQVNQIIKKMFISLILIRIQRTVAYHRAANGSWCRYAAQIPTAVRYTFAGWVTNGAI